MVKKKIVIGSRGSKLAILYAKKAQKAILDSNINLNKNSVYIKKIKTSGDIHFSKSLSEIGGKGLFSKQIEEELLNGKIDIAVHALKDLPSEETTGLETRIFLKRNDPRDVFISLKSKSIYDLKPNDIIGTSSFRRAAQLKILNKNISIKLIRGNVDTRINKLEQEPQQTGFDESQQEAFLARNGVYNLPEYFKWLQSKGILEGNKHNVLSKDTLTKLSNIG